ncbi:uncharacterized protein LOC124260966 [Haliotis rubra]|uniref:uncharacterized protein LOC124260966 n=1 Tax=Haliotis rubra TaxID=36100 RepID=UPI001EE5545B|nr:uncharacterized protein LOC124260966 [Haliotis rubra]
MTSLTALHACITHPKMQSEASSSTDAASNAGGFNIFVSFEKRTWLLVTSYCDFIDQFLKLFDVGKLKAVVQKIADNVGSNGTEAACETECTAILMHNALLSSGCDLICRSLQSLVKQFHIV